MAEWEIEERKAAARRRHGTGGRPRGRMHHLHRGARQRSSFGVADHAGEPSETPAPLSHEARRREQTQDETQDDDPACQPRAAR